MRTPTIFPSLRRHAAPLGWGAALALGAVGLACVPLFDKVGYEFCLALALPASLMGVHLGVRRVACRRRAAVGSDAQRADARPFATIVALWKSAALTALGVSLIPLAVITLNAVRVRNCDYVSGLLWYPAVPMASSILGAALGVLAGLATRRTGAALVLGLLAVLGSVAWGVWRFYAAPPIFGYDPFVGYFAGSLYDEEVSLPRALLWARAYHLTVALFALSLAACFLDGRAHRLRRAAWRGPYAWPMLALGLVATWLYAHHASLGFELSADEVASALGGTLRTEHFVIRYSPRGPVAKELSSVAREHEFRYAQLKGLFGVEPDGPITSYLFDSVEDKARLMGAQHTFIAKPWRREVYLQHEPWPHPVLMHELAHVFAGAFGDPLFHTSLKGLAFNVGMIEGVAEAAAWHGSPLTPHELVRTLRQLGREPDLGQILSTSFLGINATSAYATAGSFCRFLLDTRGAPGLREVYRAGGSPESFVHAYGAPLSQLAEEWRKTVDGTVVPEAERELVKERLLRPSIFHRVCAHELALAREHARALLGAGDHDAALATYTKVCDEDPDDPNNLEALMNAGRAVNRPDLALGYGERVLHHPKASPALLGATETALGDLALERHDRATALRFYRKAESRPSDEGQARLLTVKILATEEAPGPVADGFERLVGGGPHDAATDLLTTRELVLKAPDRGLTHYLFARQLFLRDRFAEAAESLARAIELGLPDGRFEREAARMHAVCLFRSGALDRAKQAFISLAASGAEGARLEARDWAARADFYAR
jgi:tetratricopeptide (TPR) repeat protein